MERHLACDVDAERRGAPASSLLLSVAAALLVLLVGSTCALLVPAGAGFDEPMHVARVEQLAHGRVLPQEVDLDEADRTLVGPSSDDYVGYGGQTDAALYDLVARGNKSFFQDEDREPYQLPTWEDPRLATEAQMGESTVTWLFPNTAINSPACYLPHIVGYWVASLLGLGPAAIVISMRLAGVLTLAASTLLCMRLLPVGGRLVALVALLPTSLTVNSMVTADLMTYVFVTVYLSCIVRMLLGDGARRREWALLWLSLLGICLSKVTYAPFGLLLFALPVASPAYRAPRALGMLAAIGFSSLAAFGLWYSVIHDVNTGLIWSADIDPTAQQAWVLSNPLAFLGLMLMGLLGADTLALSMWTSYTGLVTAVWPTVLALLVVFSVELCSARLARSGVRRSLIFCGFLAVVCAIVVVLVYLALYLQFNAPGAATIKGVQTRYFLPVALVLYLIALFVSRAATLRMAGDDAVRTDNVSASPAIMGDVLVLVALVTLSALNLFSFFWTCF